MIAFPRAFEAPVPRLVCRVSLNLRKSVLLASAFRVIYGEEYVPVPLQECYCSRAGSAVVRLDYTAIQKDTRRGETAAEDYRCAEGLRNPMFWHAVD